MSNSKHIAKAVFSSHHDLGSVNTSWKAKRMEDGSYEVTNKNGEIRVFQDGEEFDVPAPQVSGIVKSKTYRCSVDENRNLKFSQILKKPLHDVQNLGDGRYQFRIGNNEFIMEEGQSLVGEAVPSRTWILESDSNNAAILVSKENEFTVMVGENVMQGYYAKASKNHTYVVYGPNGKFGTFKKNSDGVTTQPAVIDNEQGKLVIKHEGVDVMIPIRYKAFERNLLVLNQKDGKGFKCFFNFKTPGTKSSGLDGIPGIFYPAEGNQPAKFMEKGEGGELYNTASFFKGNTPDTVNGVTRSTEEAKEALQRYRDSKQIGKFKQDIEILTSEIKEIWNDLSAIDVDPHDDQEYCEKLAVLTELKNKVESLTPEALKLFNNQSWGKPDSFRVQDGKELFGLTQQNSYKNSNSRTYG